MSLGTLSYKPTQFKVFSKLGFRFVHHSRLSKNRIQEALNANFDGDITYYIKNILWRKNLAFNDNAEVFGKIQRQFEIHHHNLPCFESDANPADVPVINTIDISQIEELAEKNQSFCLTTFDVHTQEIKPIAYVVKLNDVLLIIPLMDVQIQRGDLSENIVIYSQQVVKFGGDFETQGNLHVRARIIEFINHVQKLTANNIILQADEECVTRGEIKANNLCEISTGKLRHKAKCLGKDIQIMAEEVRNKGQFFSEGSIDSISLKWQDKSESCAMHAHEKIMLFSQDYQKTGHVSTPTLIVNSERVKLDGNHYVNDITFINGNNIEIADDATFVVNGKFITKSSWHQIFSGKLHYLSNFSMTGFNITVPKYCPVELPISKKAPDEAKPYFTRPDTSLQKRRMYQERYAHRTPDYFLPKEVLEKKYHGKNSQVSDRGYVVLQSNRLEMAGELNIAGVGLFLKADGDLSITGDAFLTENSFSRLTEQFCMQANNVILKGKIRASRQHQTLIQAENNVDLHGDTLASTMKVTAKNTVLRKEAKLRVDALRIDADQSFQAHRGSTLTIEQGGMINSGYVGLHGHVYGNYLDVQANQLILTTGTTHISHQIYSAPAVMLLGGWLNGKSVKVNALIAAMFGLVSAGNLEINAVINISLLAYIQSSVTCPSVTSMVNAAAGITMTGLMIFVPQARFIAPWVLFAIKAVSQLTSLAVTLKTAYKQIQDLMQKNKDHEVSKTELIKTISSMIIILTLLSSSSYFAASGNTNVNVADDKIPDLDWKLALRVSEAILPFFMSLFSGYSVTSLFSLSSNIIFSLSQTQYSLLNIQANIATLTGSSLNLSPISFDWNFASLGISMSEMNFYNYKQPGMERFIAGDSIRSYIVDLHQQFLALNHYNNLERSAEDSNADKNESVNNSTNTVQPTPITPDHDHQHSITHDLMDDYLNKIIHRHNLPKSQPQPDPSHHTEPTKTDNPVNQDNSQAHIEVPSHDIPPVLKPVPSLSENIINAVISTVDSVKDYLSPDAVGLNISTHTIYAEDDLQMVGCNIQAAAFIEADNNTCLLAGGKIDAAIQVGENSKLITSHEIVNGTIEQSEHSTVAFIDKSTVALKQDNLSSDATLVIDDSIATIDNLNVGANKVYVQNQSKLTTNTTTVDSDKDSLTTANQSDIEKGIIVVNQSEYNFQTTHGDGNLIVLDHSIINGNELDLTAGGQAIFVESDVKISKIYADSSPVEFVLDHHMQIGDVYLQGKNTLLSTEGSDGTIHNISADKNAIVSTDLSKISVTGTYAVAGSSNFNDTQIDINHLELIPHSDIHLAGSTLTYQSINGNHHPHTVKSNMSMSNVARSLQVILDNSMRSILLGDVGHHGYAPQINVNAAHFNYNNLTLVYDLGSQPIILQGSKNVFGIVPLEFHTDTNLVYKALWQMNCPVSFTANGVLILMAGSSLSASRLSLDADYGISGEGITLTSASHLSIHSSNGNISLNGQKYTKTSDTSHRKITGTSNQHTSEDEMNYSYIVAPEGIDITADNGSVDLHATWLGTDPEHGEINIVAKNHVDTRPIIGEYKQTTTGFIPPLAVYRVDVSQEVAFPTYFSTNILRINGDIIYFGGTDVSGTNEVYGKARVINLTAPILHYQVSSRSFGLAFNSLNNAAFQDALQFPVLTMFAANTIYHDLQNINGSTTDLQRSINLWNTGLDSLMLLSSMSSNPLSVLNLGLTFGYSQSNSSGTYSANNVFHAKKSIEFDADTVVIANGTEVSAGDDTNGSVTIHARELQMNGDTFTQDSTSVSVGLDISISVDRSSSTTNFPATFGVNGQYAQNSDVTHGMATIKAHDVTLDVDDIEATNGKVVAKNLHGQVGTANFIIQQDEHDNFSLGGSVRFAPDGTPVSTSLNFAMGHSSLATDQPGIIADNSDCTIGTFNGVGAVASQAVQDHTNVMNNIEVIGTQTQIGGSFGISSPIGIGNSRFVPIQGAFSYDHQSDIYALNGTTTKEQHINLPNINLVVPFGSEVARVEGIDTSNLISDDFDVDRFDNDFNIQDPAVVLGVSNDIQNNDAPQPSYEDERVDLSTLDASAIISEVDNIPDPFMQSDASRAAQEFWDSHDLPILSGDIEELAAEMNDPSLIQNSNVQINNDAGLSDLLLPSAITDIIPYHSNDWDLKDDFNVVINILADGIIQGVDDLTQAGIALPGFANDLIINLAEGVLIDFPKNFYHELLCQY